MPHAAPHDIARDDGLMRRLVAGDSTALAAIADLHGHTLFAIAYRMLGDGAEAEDIAQETLVRLWTSAARWRFGRPVMPWLRQVATNLAIDHIRRERRLSHDTPPERADPAMPADTVLAQAEVRARVAACLAALPERQRAAVVLTYYEDQPNRAVAECLAMGLKAFESLLLRARHALRACLGGYGLLAGDVLGDRP